jgi:hypothetical protein
MSVVREEIEDLMIGMVIIAKADPLPYLCLDALVWALVEEMEAMWPLISDESKVTLASIAISLKHREAGVVATPNRAAPACSRHPPPTS